MKTLFLVLSAIRTKHGCFSYDQRLEQTLDTIKSIRKKVPDAIININESSAEGFLTTEEFEKLKNAGANGIYDYSKDPQVQQIYKATENWDIIKNYTEMLITAKSLLSTGSYEDFKTVSYHNHYIDRVFKLSGRYQLSESFDINNFTYEALNDKYIFTNRRSSQFPSNITGGLTHQLMSRLWSWPMNKTKLVYARYELMIEHFVTMINKGLYVDIEHLMLKYFDGPNLVELPNIGVTGKLGPNGIIVSD